MTAHVVVVATPDPAKADGARTYVESVQPLLKAAGVQAVVRGPVAETLAGNAPAASVTVLAFPDGAAATAFFEQEAYQALIPLRDESFARMEIHALDG
ncbi:DUF1330 domain-containing protein [Rhodobacteraceae bacterium NNCM2]|nr:DUF1330 domain-containing protein [Coraliihabitans acroporae]